MQKTIYLRSHSRCRQRREHESNSQGKPGAISGMNAEVRRVIQERYACSIECIKVASRILAPISSAARTCYPSMTEPGLFFDLD